MAALYASEPQAKAVKFADNSENILEGLGMPWGGVHNGADLDGEKFTLNTDFTFDWFPERPLLYHHGLDGGPKLSVVGRVKAWEIKPDLGVWVKAQLDQQNDYFSAIADLVKRGKLYFSSGAMRHLVEVNKKTGEIKTWPWVELSLTPTPANLLAQIDLPDAEKHFETAGIKADFAAIKAAWDTAYINDLPDSAFGFVEGGGEKDEEGKTVPRSKRHFPIRNAEGEYDAAHVRNALARLSQSPFEAQARPKVEAAARALGIGEPAEGKALTTAGLRKMIRSTAGNMDIDLDDVQMDKMIEAMSGMLDDDLGDVMKELTAQLRKIKGSKAIKAQHSSYEELLEKLNALINPKSPMMASDAWSHIVATYPDYFIMCRREEGEETYWKVAYGLDAEGEVALGKAQQVEQYYRPAKSAAEVPLSIRAEALSRDAALFVERTQDLHERRIKEGRVLSLATRRRMESCLEAMRNAGSELESLLKETEPPAKAREWSWRLRLLELGTPVAK